MGHQQAKLTNLNAHSPLLRWTMSTQLLTTSNSKSIPLYSIPCRMSGVLGWFWRCRILSWTRFSRQSCMSRHLRLWWHSKLEWTSPPALERWKASQPKGETVRPRTRGPLRSHTNTWQMLQQQMINKSVWLCSFYQLWDCSYLFYSCGV